MYTLLGLVAGGLVGSMIRTKGSYASISSIYLTIAFASIGAGIGFGYGTGKLASGTHFIQTLFTRKT